MKALLCCILTLFILACRPDKEFNSFTYDGKYPVTLTGERIRTYTPTILGGTINVSFKGQPWNHGPYLMLRLIEFDTSWTGSSSTRLVINLWAMLDNPPIEPCLVESLGVYFPFRSGRFVFKKNTSTVDEIGARFDRLDCDAGLGIYKLDPNRESWAEIKHYDPVSKAAEVHFSVHFVPESRNLLEAPIYPLHFDLTGSVKGVARVFKK